MLVVIQHMVSMMWINWVENADMICVKESFECLRYRHFLYFKMVFSYINFEENVPGNIIDFFDFLRFFMIIKIDRKLFDNIYEAS